MSKWREGWLGTVAVSVSDAPDLAAFGVSEGHLRDAMSTVAARLLGLGYRLAYGGDLRPGGFTKQLSELAAAYDRGCDSNGQLPVTDYLAWPVHATMAADEKRALIESLRGVADIVMLSPDGTVRAG